MPIAPHPCPHLGTAHPTRLMMPKRQNSHRIHAGSTAAYGPHFRQKSTFGEFWRGIIRQQCTHRAVSRANLHPYMMHVAWDTLQKPWDSTRTDAGVKHQLVLSAYPQRGPGSCCGVVSGRRGAVPLHSMSPRHPLGTFDTLGTPAVATTRAQHRRKVSKALIGPR